MHIFSHRNPKPAKTCAVIRYGGLGDSIQVSSILPWLKGQGYHITIYTTPTAWELIKHDPYIDAVVLQDVDAIPNHDLGEFWNYTKRKYDKFINLSESIEKTLLTMPGTISHGWSHEMRNKYLNHNYMQFIHDISGVPMPSKMKFYPTKEETNWARSEYQKMRGRVILWVLSGSAVHKVWPHFDYAMDSVLKNNSDTRFVLVGDKSCKKLEEGWENTSQVYRRSGEWTIRETIAFAQECDLVIGPETGVMNAIAFDSVPKIVTLSHSSVENLTRDWANCTSLYSVKTPCYPCHRIQFNWEHCNQYENTGVALCQVNISLDSMLNAIDQKLRIAA